MNTATTNETFKQFSENFTKGTQAAGRFFEDGFKFWSDMASRTSDDFRNRVERMADEVLPLSKKSAERFQKMFDENVQRGVSVMKHGMDMNPLLHPVGTPAELMDRSTSFFRVAADATRESADAMMKAGSETMREWSSVRCDAPVATVAGEGASKRK